MKTYVSLTFLFFVLIGYTQNTEEDNVKLAITDFFEAFHKQDTLALKEMAVGNINMQSIFKDKKGDTQIHSSDYHKFIKGIASIPKSTSFEEKLLSFDIKVDDIMANAWVAYEFWLNGTLSHCGVNSFQFMKTKTQWKIIYLVDTRRRQDCIQKNLKD